MNELPPIGVVLYTHNRVDDAAANIEIIRELWPQVPALANAHIVHTYNGKQHWYPRKTGEDTLLRLGNDGIPGRDELKHYAAAANLMNVGINEMFAQCPDAEFVIVVAADAWFIKPGQLANVLEQMKSQNRPVASVPWFGFENVFTPNALGLGLDCFIFNKSWAVEHNLFPLDYAARVLSSNDFLIPEQIFEQNFTASVAHELRIGIRDVTADQLMQRFFTLNRGSVMKDPDGKLYREWDSAELGLTTDHSTKERVEFLQSVGFQPVGPMTLKLMESPFQTLWNYTDGPAAVSFT